MNRIPFVTIGTVLTFALTAVAQQTATQRDGSGPSGVPTIQEQLKLLTERLTLTGDQRAKIKPILQQLHDATLKLVQDESTPREERVVNVRAWREKTDKKIREVLNDDQKKKLDQLEQEPHPESAWQRKWGGRNRIEETVVALARPIVAKSKSPFQIGNTVADILMIDAMSVMLKTGEAPVSRLQRVQAEVRGIQATSYTRKLPREKYQETTQLGVERSEILARV